MSYWNSVFLNHHGLKLCKRPQQWLKLEAVCLCILHMNQWQLSTWRNPLSGLKNASHLCTEWHLQVSLQVSSSSISGLHHPDFCTRSVKPGFNTICHFVFIWRLLPPLWIDGALFPAEILPGVPANTQQVVPWLTQQVYNSFLVWYMGFPGKRPMPKQKECLKTSRSPHINGFRYWETQGHL